MATLYDIIKSNSYAPDGSTFGEYLDTQKDVCMMTGSILDDLTADITDDEYDADINMRLSLNLSDEMLEANIKLNLNSDTD